MSEMVNMKRVFQKAMREVVEQPPFQPPVLRSARAKKFNSKPAEIEAAKTPAGEKPWQHDLYVEKDQGPKTALELIKTYGYDIRKGPAPKDPSSCAKLSFFHQTMMNSKTRNSFFRFFESNPNFDCFWHDDKNNKFRPENYKKNAQGVIELIADHIETDDDSVDSELSDFLSAISLKPKDGVVDEPQEEVEPPKAAPPTPERTDSPINIYMPPEDYPFMSILTLNLFEDEDQTDAMDVQTFPSAAARELFPFMEAHGPNHNIFYYQKAYETPMELDE